MMIAPAKDAESPLYRHLIQSVTDYAIYMLDLSGHVTSWNAGAQRAKGYTADEIAGRHFSRFYTDEDQARGLPSQALATALALGRFETEGWRVRKDGSHLWAHVVIDLVENDDGTPIGFAKITKDRTEQHRAHQASLESERRFRHLVQGVTDYAIYMLDLGGHVTNWNAGAERAKGYTADEIVGRHFSCFYTDEERALGAPAMALDTALTTGRFEGEGRRRRKDGTCFWAHVMIDLIRDEDGSLIGFAKITRDVTRQKADADRLARITSTLDAALSNIKHGLCLFNADMALQLANRRFLDMFGRRHDAILTDMSFHTVIRDVVLGGLAAPEEVRAFCERHLALVRCKSDRDTIEDLPGGVAISISHSRMQDGSWVSTFEDVTQRKKAEKTIAELAHLDSLTGLANRRSFRQRLTSLAGERSASPDFVVMLLDLDDFKIVNDSYGHAAGDSVLRHVAEILRATAPVGHLAARLGGDEFAIVLNGMSEPQALALAQDLIRDIAKPLAFEPDVIAQIGASIGIASASPDCCEVDDLLMRADIALYEAKKGGKSALRLYSADLSAKVRAKRELEADLRASVLARSGFTLHYQPIINMGSRAVTAREALLRWRHPRQGDVLPSVFIPLAEELGLIGQLGQWVLDRACGDARWWKDGVRVAINLSPLQLGGHGFVNRVTDALDRSGLPPSRLEFEITETTLLDDGSDKLDDLHKIHDLGVKVALDDFGIGFSSLAHVRAFPFDRIKIDGSFVRDAVARADCAVIVGIVVELGRRLGMSVVAEGVETQEHLDLAIREGCHEAQGHLLGYPKAMVDGHADACDQGLPAVAASRELSDV